MAASDKEFEDVVYKDVESRGGLPDPTREQKLSWDEVRALVPKPKQKLERVDPRQVNELLTQRDKKKFEELSRMIWPPRTKTDLSLRRTRLLDWVKVMRRLRREDELRQVMLESKVGWDVVFLTNIICATSVIGTHWYQRWHSLGAFDSDLSHYLNVAKTVGNIAKSSGIHDDNWMDYAECGVIGGYRNPPFPGFDVVKETELLAHGGEEHNFFTYTFEELVDAYLDMPFKPMTYVPFSEWVKKAEWLTAGASSVGRVIITTADGKTHNIKARKNMVADVVDLGELAEQALHHQGQQNFTIIKSELGKLRLAVAGDIYSYLKMTWINSLLNGAYYAWPGSTMDEGFEEQTKRLAKMLELCAKSFGLPYDYAGFDHQPTTNEIVTIVRKLCRHARLNVPKGEQAEYDAIVQNVIQGFSTATLEVRVATTQPVKFDVTGGLMSGLRWTSTVGNAWNTVMTGAALRILREWGMPTDKIERYIRGDDSAIFTPNWATGVGMNLAYDAIGAKAGVGKFSLQYRQMEFLRVWFSDRCEGYAIRALPGLTQRKPWSNNPWSEDMVLRAIFETVRTLRRRKPERRETLDIIWSELKSIWCQNHNLPNAITMVPAYQGGLGLESAEGAFVYKLSAPVPRITKSEYKIDNQTEWRKKRIEEYAKQKYDMVIDNADELASAELKETIASDNIPEVAKITREKWLQEVRRLQIRATKQPLPTEIYPIPYDIAHVQPENISELEEIMRAKAPLYGSCPEIQQAKVDYQRFAPNMTFTEWLRRYFPKAYIARRKFHRSWHLSEVLDYLAGKLTVNPKQIHPALTHLLALEVAIALKPQRRTTRLGSAWLSSTYERHIWLSPISQKTYAW